MKRTLLTIMAVSAVCGMSYAQKGEEKPAGAAVPAEARMMTVAGELVQYGYANKEALPLIQAVEIYQKNGSDKPFEGKKENAGDKAESKQSKVSYDVNQILADATEYAAGDENLLALIDGLKSSSKRGATSNYAVHTDLVRANSTDVYNVQFRGGELALVIVSGDGDTDLDLYGYDPAGNCVASDADYTDDCVVSWVPTRTQTYKIKIKNRGNISNRYRMAVN